MRESIFNETMAEMTWPEIEIAAKEKAVLLFPIGVIEEHGPHLPLGTDCYVSYQSCLRIKRQLEKLGQKTLIVPPYYYGINYVTGGFPGSFSVREETMNAVLTDILDNLNNWHFENVFLQNCHGDPVHIKTLLNVISATRIRNHQNVKLLIESYELGRLGIKEDDPSILPLIANGVPEELIPFLFELEPGKFDIHAGATETAYIQNYYPELVNSKEAKEQKSTSLTIEQLKIWSKGGRATRELVPSGVAGNPAGYEAYKDMDQMDDILSYYEALDIMKSLQK